MEAALPQAHARCAPCAVDDLVDWYLKYAMTRPKVGRGKFAATTVIL
jgi:hypothetical protein